jgi:uncharacterized protein YjlB
VAHRLLEDLTGGGEGFCMVGGYPKGCSWDMCYGQEGEEDKAKAVAGVRWFERDPLYGKDGPTLWGREKTEERGRSEL